jgi:hypothetical protein
MNPRCDKCGSELSRRDLSTLECLTCKTVILPGGIVSFIGGHQEIVSLPDGAIVFPPIADSPKSKKGRKK